MPDPTQNQNNLGVQQVTDTPPIPVFSSQNVNVSDNQNSPSGSNFFPPGNNSSQKKKFGNKRVIATFLGILLLVAGIATGIILVLQPQLLQQKAVQTEYVYTPNCQYGNYCLGLCAPQNCVDTINDPNNCGGVGRTCDAGYSCKNGSCTVNTDTSCKVGDNGAPVCCTANDISTCDDIVCEPPARKECHGSNGKWCTIEVGSSWCSNNPNPTPKPPTSPPQPTITPKPTPTKSPSPTPTKSPSPTPTKSPSPTPTKSPSPTPTKSPSPTPTKSPSPTPTKSPSPTPVPQCNSICSSTSQCLSGQTCLITTGATSGNCRNPSCTGQSNCLCPTATPSPSPTPSPGPTAVCTGIKAYDSAWNQLSTTQLSGLKAGNNIVFCVAGTTNSSTFDMARFTINSAVQSDTTVKRPNTNDYCQAYTIPAGVYTFTVTAQIHHVILGWIGP